MDQYIQLRSGPHVPVKVRGYQARGLVAQYYRQKCQFGLYQALHRIRPYIKKEYDRHVFIFTNMPIEGVDVDEVLGRTWRRLVGPLARRLAEQDVCTVSDLADLATRDGERRATVTQLIRDNSQMLAKLTDTEFVQGSPGRFARST